MQVPETRPSILLRVSNAADEEAWMVFESIYRPVIVRTAQIKGLQQADAEDVAQLVLARLAERPAEFQPGAGNARFRTWLGRVTENAVIDRIRKQGREAELIAKSAHTAETSCDTQLQQEYRREVFQWAAKIVRGEFSPDTWDAFWQTSVELRPIDDVARELKRSVGSIYSSRARIMRRLREQVRRFDEALEGEL